MQEPQEDQPSSTNLLAGVIKSEFLERVSEIPVVNAAKEYGTSAYQQVKQLNKFTTVAMSVAETAALFFAVSAKPIFEKVQPQVQAVDQLACIGLDTVQEKAPFLLKPPEQLVEDARKICHSTLATGHQTADTLKSMGAETLRSVKSYGLQKANVALSETEDLLEKYLPPANGECSYKPEANTIQERATQLSSKIGTRLYDHGVKHLLPIHRISQESVSKLFYTIELLQQLKENCNKKTVQDHVDKAKVKATWIWEELNKEHSEATDAEKSLEQRMLSLARRTTSDIVHAYNLTAVPLTSFPAAYQQSLNHARKYASELFSIIDQATNAGEVTVSILHNVREKLEALESTIKNLTEQTEQKTEQEQEELIN